MPKFYVQSGNVSLVIAANHAEQAALWALNHTVNNYFPVDDVECRLLNEVSFRYLLRGLSQLDEIVSVSQRGWGKADAGSFETHHLFETWCRSSHTIRLFFDLWGFSDQLFGKLLTEKLGRSMDIRNR